jgi:hypothetical protein
VVGIEEESLVEEHNRLAADTVGLSPKPSVATVLADRNSVAKRLLTSDLRLPTSNSRLSYIQAPMEVYHPRALAEALAE